MPDDRKTATRADVCMLIAKSEIMQHWHWFRYHFGTLNVPGGWEHPLAANVIDALVVCDKAMPGYAQSFVTRLSAIGGKEKFLPHYEQLIQQLAELHVVLQVVSFDWRGAQFAAEPTAEASKKNPEITVRHDGIIYGIEVKAPALIAHIKARGSNATQVPARVFSTEMLATLKKPDEAMTLPRDNPVKDFLMSADAKFAAFKQEQEHFIGLLVIVWDDHIYEPISSLLHESSGLLTPKSFHIDASGAPFPYANVDGVFLIRHLHQLIRATRDEPLIDGCGHPLEYGTEGAFPFKVFVQNPKGNEVPAIIQHCLQGMPPAPEMGAEYTPKDLVWWLPVNDAD
jgi:hypothetical protein